MNVLNAQQHAAVTYLDGPLLVVAGAGSGKTSVITQKIVWLIQKAGYEAKNVFAVTFTNKAAREMLARSRSLLDKQARGLKISTFHRLGLEILRLNYAACGLRRGFSIFDARDSVTVIRDIIKSDDDALVRTIQARISAQKNTRTTLSDLSEDIDALVEQVYTQYNARLQAYNAVDFDDLLRLPVMLLEKYTDFRAHWQQQVRYLLIDEYQDTNEYQYALMQLLTGASAAFTAVGDDDQSIYAWRGAKTENIAHLMNDYPSLKIVKLEQNYRCHKKILNAANALITNNYHLVEKRLWSQLDSGEGVRVITAKTDVLEAEQVVNDIFICQLREANKFSDFAILYRSNFQARVLEEALRTLKIPYVISGGTSFFEHSEVRDLLAYLRLISNFDDDAAFLRICNTPKRGIGATTLTQLSAITAQRHISLMAGITQTCTPKTITKQAFASLREFASFLHSMQKLAETALPADVLKTLIDEIDYKGYLLRLYPEAAKLEKHTARIAQLVDWLTRLQEDTRFSRLDNMMQHLTLLDILAHQEKKTDAVQLMTLHAAKGLEFRNVYIIGVEEGLLPHANSSDSEENLAEERRLLYVGMTRAKENLILSYVQQRQRARQWQAVKRSRFLDELPDEGVQWHDGSRKIDKQQIQQQTDQMFASLHALLRESE